MRRLRLTYVVLATLASMALTTPVFGQARVGGVVRDVEGKPIRGATVKALNSNVTPGQFTATTDDKGRFAMIGLRSGVWRFVAEAPGYQAQEGNAPIRQLSAGNPPLEFTLQRAVVGPPSLGKDVQSGLDAANALRDSGQFDQAISAYQAIKTKNPGLTMINMVIGGAYRQKAAREREAAAKQTIYKQAIAAYQEVLKTEPDNEHATVEISLTHMAAGDFDAAERILASSVASESASRELFYSLGELKFHKGDLAGAEAMHERALDVDPHWLAPKLRLGVIASTKGDKVAAIRIFEGIVAANPSSPDAAEAGGYLKELKK
jgi:tetratricopeptide (TPR) repeat protein